MPNQIIWISFKEAVELSGEDRTTIARHAKANRFQVRKNPNKSRGQQINRQSFLEWAQSRKNKSNSTLVSVVTPVQTELPTKTKQPSESSLVPFSARFYGYARVWLSGDEKLAHKPCVKRWRRRLELGKWMKLFVDKNERDIGIKELLDVVASDSPPGILIVEDLSHIGNDRSILFFRALLNSRGWTMRVVNADIKDPSKFRCKLTT